MYNFRKKPSYILFMIFINTYMNIFFRSTFDEFMIIKRVINYDIVARHMYCVPKPFSLFVPKNPLLHTYTSNYV